MSEEKELRAKRAFETLKKALEADNWPYKAVEEDNTVFCKAQGEDLPIDIKFAFNDKIELAIVMSRIPFNISEEKRIDAALAVNMVNGMLVDGCFEYDVTTGAIYFRTSNSFAGTELSADLLMSMLIRSCKIVDDYNDRFLMLDKGMLSLEDFIIS